MDLAGIPALIEAIRHMHGAAARHVETVRVTEKAPTGETVWDGYIAGNPMATRCYAWSEATRGTKRRFFAVLHVPPITSAAMAVRGSILADGRL